MNRAPQFITSAIMFLYAALLALSFAPGAVVILIGAVALLIVNRPRKEKSTLSTVTAQIQGPKLVSVPLPAAAPPVLVPLPAAVPPVPALDPALSIPIQKNYKQENFHVTGTQYYKKGWEGLSSPNEYYDMKKSELIDMDMIEERIYQYNYTARNIILEPDPTNPYDPNAIKVLAGGNLVGYIKKGSTSRIRNIMKAGIVSISAEAEGGKYKLIDEDGTMERGDAPYFMNLTIKFNGENKNGDR